MFYIVIILLTTFFFYLAVNLKFSKAKNAKLLFFVFVALTVLIPSIVAGVRDLSIGTDTRGYLLADFNISNNVSSIRDAAKLSNEELGFISLVYFVTHVFGNIHVLMFIIEFIIMCFVVKYALSANSKDEACAVILFYMFLCFANSMCIMRQHISLAILLFSTRLFKEKKYLNCVLLFILAYLFHSSAMCFLLIYWLLYISEKHSLPVMKRKYFIICIVLSLAILNLPFFLNILINVLHILPSRYNLYISSSWFYSSADNSIITLRFILNTLFIIIIWLSYIIESDDNNKKRNFLTLILMILNMILYVESRRFLILSRFSIYFFYGAILLNPVIVKQLKFNEKIKISKKGYFKSVLKMAVLILVLATFYGDVITNSNYYNLYPYISIWGGK